MLYNTANDHRSLACSFGMEAPDAIWCKTATQSKQLITDYHVNYDDRHREISIKN